VRQFQLALRLTQAGNAITGTMTATNAVGGPVFNNGIVSGALSGSSLTFTMTVPVGGIVDAPDCAASFAAVSTDLLATSMAGTYTGTDTCGNTYAGGRFQLIKD
jgi:hypothetical protein